MAEVRVCKRVKCGEEFVVRGAVQESKVYCCRSCARKAVTERQEERYKWLVEHQDQPREFLIKEMGFDTGAAFANLCKTLRKKGYNIRKFYDAQIANCKVMRENKGLPAKVVKEKVVRVPKPEPVKKVKPEPEKKVKISYRQVRPDAKPMKVKDFTDGYVSMKRDSKTWVVKKSV